MAAASRPTVPPLLSYAATSRCSMGEREGRNPDEAAHDNAPTPVDHPSAPAGREAAFRHFGLQSTLTVSKIRL